MASHATTSNAGPVTEGLQAGCDTYRNRHLVRTGCIDEFIKSFASNHLLNEGDILLSFSAI